MPERFCWLAVRACGRTGPSVRFWRIQLPLVKHRAWFCYIAENVQNLLKNPPPFYISQFKYISSEVVFLNFHHRKSRYFVLFHTEKALDYVKYVIYIHSIKKLSSEYIEPAKKPAKVKRVCTISCIFITCRLFEHTLSHQCLQNILNCFQ